MNNDIDVRSETEIERDLLTKRKARIHGRKQLEEQQIAYMQTEGYATMLNPIVVCRGVMRETLDDDEGFRQGYIANIAMLLYDNLEISGIEHGLNQRPVRVSLAKCNDLAEQIHQKIFYDE